MKKISSILILILALCMLAACSSSKGDDVSETEAPDSGNNEFIYREAGIKDLKINLEKSWEYQEDQSGDTGMAFTNGNAVLGITCANESVYQSGREMTNQLKRIYSGFPDYKLIQDATKITVNDLTWYEIVISYKESEEDEEGVILYERCFGQDYSAYTVSLTAQISEYDSIIEEAKAAMDTTTVEAEHNDQTKAREALSGRWGLSTGGLLVLNEDGTYQWYMDAGTKDPNFMHEGIYGCDDEVKTLSTGKGMGYYYLCLFPEHLFSDGKELETAEPVYHFAISHASGKDDNIFEMVNITSMDIYTIIKLSDTQE